MPTTRRFTLAASSYSFHRLTLSGESSLFDTPRLAREAGAEAIEFAVGGSLAPDLDDLTCSRLLEACTASNCPVCSVVVAAELYQGDLFHRQSETQRVIEQMEYAQALGARLFRHDATLGPKGGDLSEAAFDRALPVVADSCRQIADRAAQLNMRSSIENHGLFMQHADRVARLVEAVAHPAFGITLDIGNSLFADQNHVEAAARLAPYAINVHVKDFIVNPSSGLVRKYPESLWQTFPDGPAVMGCVPGEGDVDIDACLRAVIHAGYAGPLVLEFEGPNPDPRDAVKIGIRFVRETIDESMKEESVV